MVCSSGIKLSHKGFKVSVRFGCNQMLPWLHLIVNDFYKTVQIQNITLLSQYGFLWLKYVCIQYNILAYLRNETVIYSSHKEVWLNNMALDIVI